MSPGSLPSIRVTEVCGCLANLTNGFAVNLELRAGGGIVSPKPNLKPTKLLVSEKLSCENRVLDYTGFQRG